MPHQARADGIDALVAGHRRQRRIGGRIAERQLLGQRGITQRLADHPGAGQHAQVAVGQFGQLGAATGQVPGGAALGDHQCQHLAQGQALLGHADSLSASQRPVAPREVGAEPYPQAVTDAMHLAVAGGGGQRHAVDVVVDDLLAQGQGRAALVVGADAGREHLPQLFRRVDRAPLQRVAELLDLGGQGAATGRVGIGVQLAGQLGPGGYEEARPVHGRVLRHLLGVEQMTVLNEQQARHHQRWNLGEGAVMALRVAEVEHRGATAVADIQAGEGFFPVGRIQAVTGVLEQRRGKAYLAFDLEALGLELVDELREADIAQALVERSVLRIADGIAGAGLDAKFQLGRPVAEQTRLPFGGLRLAGGQHADSHRRGQQRQGKAPTDPPDAAFACRRRLVSLGRNHRFDDG
ncbi:hypothetical protein D3C85_596680 [compost metagenome]